jgi:hypothetical protein
MDLDGISEADRYLLYGLLLRKRRTRALEREVMAIIRSSRGLNERITALMELQEKEDSRLASLASPGRRVGGDARRGARKRGSILVVDVHPEVTKLLRKCSLKRLASFSRIGESFDAVHLIRRLGTRLIILNELLPPDDYLRYFEICRAIQPRIRIIYLCAPPRGLDGSEVFTQKVRFVPKPINMERLEAAALELLDGRG